MDLATGGLAAALVLGFLLGLRHATDADHVVAVSTIVSEERNVLRGLWIGASWGLGHTTPLLVLGSIILLLKEAVLHRYEAIAPVLEFGVGIMLVFLGVQVWWKLRTQRLHMHEHTVARQPHVHVHAHSVAVETAGGVQESHRRLSPGKPFIRVKSYVIGIVHGLAGSAAVMLLLLPQVESFWVGLGYIVLFGVGTMLSMAGITVALSVPFAYSARFKSANRLIAQVAGTASVLFGVALMSDLALGTHFLGFLPE